MPRLTPALEVASMLRRAETTGGFGTVLNKGDAERGAILLVIARRGEHVACLERILTLDGNYAWQRTGPAESASPGEVAQFLARKTRFDGDLWLIELDIAEPERFIAETTSSG